MVIGFAPTGQDWFLWDEFTNLLPRWGIVINTIRFCPYRANISLAVK